MKIYFNEYLEASSNQPVDCTVGLQSKDEAVKHGQSVCKNKGYRGFWISSKTEGSKALPKRLEYVKV